MPKTLCYIVVNKLSSVMIQKSKSRLKYVITGFYVCIQLSLHWIKFDILHPPQASCSYLKLSPPSAT